MKNKMKWVLSLSLLLLSANCVMGQNLVREISWDDSNSIIRRYTDDTLIIYSCFDKQKTFLKTCTTNNTVWCLSLVDNNVTVNDFEIFNDTVYFCGSLNGQTPRALFGMFPLSGFPSCTVEYFIINQLRSFGKMAMFSVLEQTHAALTASYDENYGTMVDLIRHSPSVWGYFIADRKDSCEIFDDVAVTSDHIVYTSRDFWLGELVKFGKAQIVYHDIPLYYGTTFLTSNAFLNVFNNMSATCPILIKHSWSDQFGIVNTTDNNVLSIGRFVGHNYTESADIPLDNGTTIRDLGYNEENMEYELLINVQNPSTVGSYIYHIEDYCFLYSTLVYGHYFDSTIISSLDKVFTPDLLMHVASGHRLTNPFIIPNPNPHLRLYRYKYTLYNCSWEKHTESDVNEYEIYPWETNITIQYDTKELSVLEHINEDTPIETICGKRNDEQ